MSFQTQLKEYVDNAPVRTAGNFIQYGKLTCEINVLTWQGKGQKPLKEAYEEDMEIDARKQALEVTFSVGVQELNPSLQFESWSRKVLIERSGDKIKTDWSETVLKSLEAVFGDKWTDVCLGKITPYVEVEQANSQYVKPGAEKDYGVPKILRSFKNKNECIEARNERYGDPEEAESFEMGIPKDIVKQAHGLWKSMKKNDDKTLKLFKNEPFDEYDADAILEEVKSLDAG